MRRCVVALSLVGLLLVPSAAPAQTTRNLLRNGSFQDDWLTLLAANKNHHWCYSSEFYNRRDFNPDTWFCKGSWRWLNADAPRGQRHLILQGPDAQLTQRVNWVLVHDSRTMGSMADAGGYPALQPQRSRSPLRLVRDLTLRVRLKGKDVPAKAGAIELALCPPGQLTLSDPMGSSVAPTAMASVPLPAGTYDWRWLEVQLPAAGWLKASQDAAAKNATEAAEVAKSGLVLPGTVSVAIRYQAAAGSIEVQQAELIEPSPAAPNLLPNGSFESADADGYPVGWEQPVKYHHFPGRLYYLFNTWHNGAWDNRGPVTGDRLVAAVGSRSLQMIVAAGDEKSVASKPVVLNQKEPRLIEVSALVKTDRLCMLQIDAVSDKGERLDGFNFIHMAPVSIGTDDWRLVRQVFRPRQPVQSLRLLLCARGVNGYALDDTGTQPQNNVVGTIWWDDVRLTEPESTAEELAARGARPVHEAAAIGAPRLDDLDLGERLLGDNVLSATLAAPAPGGTFVLQWEFASPSGKKSQFKSPPVAIPGGGRTAVRVPYVVTETCPAAYTEYCGRLTLLDDKGKPLSSSALWFSTWTTPIELKLGALYLLPQQKQFVRMNLGLSAAAMANLRLVRLEVVRRGTGQVLGRALDVDASPAAIQAQQAKLPQGLRGDLTNLVLADVDVAMLPVQPFHDPQRNWFIRATARDTTGKVVAVAESAPFCRLGHEPAQPAIQSVAIKDNLLFINNQPWLPWGVVYGHVPVYHGPADPGAGKYLDWHNLPAWSLYDRFTAEPYTRSRNDFNCLRYVAGSISDPKQLDKKWTEDNLYCSSAFVVPDPVFGLDQLLARAGGKDKLDAYLAFCKNGPMIVATAPGIEEAFGNFHDATPAQLQGLGQVVEYLRKATGKPVMVGHGGYWNRFEFEKVRFFDIYDPETEPLYPANLHTDLWPLVHGKDKVIWLRPQMYEDVPYERWRFHVYVELMRGCRGWQIAHGPGDQSLFRGLHGELAFLKPIVAAKDPGPAVRIEPWIEHWSRRHDGKTYLIAATTRGITLGSWRWSEEPAAEKAPVGRSRVTDGLHECRDETNSYGADQPVERGPSIHGIQNLPSARAWPAGSKLVQWVRLDPRASPKNLVLLAKADGRWTHAAAWGPFDAGRLRKEPKLAYWFLLSFYRHARGFLGWDARLVEKALAYVPGQAADMGALPSAGKWVKLEVPLEKIGAVNAMLDGVGFLHEGGRVWWGRTSLVGPEGNDLVVWGDAVGLPSAALARTAIHVSGLKAGAKVRVLFEDRELTGAEGHFLDDFRGQDQYERYGGPGYGPEPVALHVYEIEPR
jgi:hypothetical protein